MKRIVDFLLSFFSSRGKPQPVYFWITILMILTTAAYIMRLCNVVHIDNALILGVLGFVAAWIALYNRQRNGGGPNAE